MIVYGHRSRTIDLPSFLADVERRLLGAPAAARDRIVDLFVDFGEAYAAVADAASPAVDDLCPRAAPWDAVMAALADATCAAVFRDVEAAANGLKSAAVHFEGLSRTADGGGSAVEASVAEGFAYYALYPQQYVLAANGFLEAERPSHVTCLGLRTIGGPLAHVVAAAARRRGVATSVLTARPRGHPFDRSLRLSQAMRCELARGCNGHGVVVDEGPGLSGSSFAAGLEALRDAGFRDDRIALFPSWNAVGESLRSERGRRAFRTTARFVVDFDRAVPLHGWADVGAGRWRTTVFGDDERCWPAAHPQHERRKYRSADGRLVQRFIGLGRHGAAMRARAGMLADAGFVAAPRRVERAFLHQDWVEGTPLTTRIAAAAETLGTIADYLAFVSRSFRTGRAARVDDLLDMIQVNCTEAKIPANAVDFERMARVARTFDEPEVAVDGRMQPHEWIQAGGRTIKTDALDHHADDFLPGCRDIAWDIAGAIVELDLDDAAAARLVENYVRRTGDRSLVRRLEFYTLAYAVYRLGYASLAAETLAGGEAWRFIRLQDSYRRSLAARARHPVPAPRR